ncbi:hypothetical protein [Shinella zoogloeoides]|uniref:hypothetical protein n=1 Tax=Shinella zoogloeoides TaxID=352475 RepID=UPI001F59EF22|nr:hypothetical protein [Shinella zoogloeoides]
MTDTQNIAERARHTLARIWRPHLSTDEFAVCHYVLDATVERGEVALFASFTELSAGRPAPEGSLWPWKLPPIGMPRSTFYRALRGLRAKGVIDAERMGACTRFEVFLDWQPEAGGRA